MSPAAAHLFYFLAWLSFALGHSLLATAPARDFLHRHAGPAARLAYNLIAVGHIVAVVALGHWLLGDHPRFAFPAAIDAIRWALLAAGIAVFAVASRGYDLGRLAGTAQWRAAKEGRNLPEDEPLRTGGLHRHVRHPLYLGGLLLLWGLVRDPLSLATAVWGSAYLVIGARFEERKLLRLYGEAYRVYRARVPAFLPWRGRAR